MSAPRPVRRVVRRRPAPPAASDRLADAIHTLLQASGAGDPLLIPRGLEVLTTHLGAELATLVTVAGSRLEAHWWFPETGEAPPPVQPFCEWLAAHPERMLVVQDMAEGPHLKGAGHLRELPHRAALGCALRKEDGVRALIFAFFSRPRRFHRMDFALLEAVGGFLGRMLETEDLKHSLHRLEDALAITQAVMEDSSIRDPETDLPNLRYLEVWEKALLGSHDRPPSLIVAECRFHPKSRKDLAKLRTAAESIRAGDLVARVGPDRIQVILRHTPRTLAHIQLLRFRSHLGGAPMGATLWIPGQSARSLAACEPLLQEALVESGGMETPTLVWRLPQGYTEGPPPGPAPQPQEPLRWKPPVLPRT